MLPTYPNLETLLELGGEYQFLVSYFAKTAHDFTDFLHELSKNLGNTPAQRLCSERVYWEYSGVKHLCPTIPPLQPVRMGDQGRIELDALDFKILLAFGGPEGNRTIRIAQQVGIPNTTVAYRLEKLREKNIIKRTVYWINPATSGAICFRLHIVFRHLTKASETQLLEYCRGHPNVLTCIRLIGGWDFDLRVEAPNAERVGALAYEIRSRFSEVIESVSIIPVLDFVKVDHFPIRNP